MTNFISFPPPLTILTNITYSLAFSQEIFSRIKQQFNRRIYFLIRKIIYFRSQMGQQCCNANNQQIEIVHDEANKGQVQNDELIDQNITQSQEDQKGSQLKDKANDQLRMQFYGCTDVSSSKTMVNQMNFNIQKELKHYQQNVFGSKLGQQLKNTRRESNYQQIFKQSSQKIIYQETGRFVDELQKELLTKLTQKK